MNESLHISNPDMLRRFQLGGPTCDFTVDCSFNMWTFVYQVEYLTGCFEGHPIDCQRQLWDFAFRGAVIDGSM